MRGPGVRQDEGLPALAGPGEAAREMGQAGGWGSRGPGPERPARRGSGGPQASGTRTTGVWGSAGLRDSRAGRLGAPGLSDPRATGVWGSPGLREPAPRVWGSRGLKDPAPGSGGPRA